MTTPKKKPVIKTPKKSKALVAYEKLEGANIGKLRDAIDLFDEVNPSCCGGEHTSAKELSIAVKSLISACKNIVKKAS